MFKKNLWIVALFMVAAIAFMGCLEALPVDGADLDPTRNPIVDGAAYLRVFNKSVNSYDTLDIKTYESDLLEEIDHTITVWGKSARGTAHTFGQGLSPWSGFGGGVTADGQGMFEMTRDFVWTNELDKNIRINCPLAVPEYFIYEIVIEDSAGKIVYQMSKDPEIQEAVAGQIVIDGSNQTLWLKNSGGAKAEIVVPGAAAADPLEGEIDIDGQFKPAFYVGSEIVATFSPDGDDIAFAVTADEVTNYTFTWRGEGRVDTEYNAGVVTSKIVPTAAGIYAFTVICDETGNFASESVTVTAPSAGTLSVSGSPSVDSLVTVTHDHPAGVFFVYQWANSTGLLAATKDFTPTDLGLHTLVATAIAPALFAGARATLDITVANLVPGGNLTIAGGNELTTANITLTATHATPGAVPGGTTYQWYKDDVAIGGATANTFIVINSFANTGTYSVVAKAATYGDRFSNDHVMEKAAAFNVAFPGGAKAITKADFTVDNGEFTGIADGYRIFSTGYGDVVQFKMSLTEGDLDTIENISFTIAMPGEGGGKNYTMLASLAPITDGLPGLVRGTAATNSRANVWSEKTILGPGTDEGIYFGAEPDQAGVYVIVKNPGTGRPGWGDANSNAYGWVTSAHPMNLLVGEDWDDFVDAFNDASDGSAIDVYFAIYGNTASGDGPVINVTNIGFFDGEPTWKAWAGGTAFGLVNGVIDASTSDNDDVWDWFANDAPAGCIKGRLTADLVAAIRDLGANGKFKLTLEEGANGNFGTLPAGNFEAEGSMDAAIVWEVPVLDPVLMDGGNAGCLNLNTWTGGAGVVKIEVLHFR